jgi:hypothetical protein
MAEQQVGGREHFLEQQVRIEDHLDEQQVESIEKAP